MGHLFPREVRNQATDPEEPAPAESVAMGAKGRERRPLGS